MTNHKYTHKLEIVEPVSQETFRQIIKLGNKIIKGHNENNRWNYEDVVTCGQNEFKKKKKKIQINGDGSNSYETFYIKPDLMKAGSTHTFKTNDKPYDKVVGAICMLAEAASGGAIRYSGGNIHNKMDVYCKMLRNHAKFTVADSLWPMSEAQLVEESRI